MVVFVEVAVLSRVGRGGVVLIVAVMELYLCMSILMCINLKIK